MKARFKIISSVLFLCLFYFSCASTQHLKIQKKSFSTNFNSNFQQDWIAKGHTFANNLAHFSEKNISTDNEALILSLKDEKLNDKDYSGAEIRTQKMFLYGRFEVKMKAAKTLGCISAFFLYRPDSKNNTEIDFEVSGKYPNVITTNHWVDRKSHDEDIPLEFDSSQDFHTYTIDWQPHQIIWSIDGKVIRQTKIAVPQKAMQVVFNLWATKSEKWAGKINPKNLPTFAYFKTFQYTPYRNYK